MAKPNTKPVVLHLTPTLLFIFLIISFPSSSSARLFGLPLNLEAEEPTLHLALPGDNVAGPYPWEKDSPRVLPCDMEPRNSKVGFPSAPKHAGKYGPMIFSMLPKGNVPKSEPSPGTNDINN
ncbi:hypothetical protein CJ030_MR3G002739 [Morella rubra]|uniref:Uncharacterized protein n=1 Tax=Morella rubra TaxID=262757 RepID=A0A6A1VXA8_9ROSI|nr:hypothetical protein CJ030_MR3G002739 [Morella rubra]